MSPRVVFVALGTDMHPFDRLVAWAQDLHERENIQVFVQHGSTALPPHIPGAGFLKPRDLAEMFESARAVVCHGGPGLIMEARDAGHLPLVVPRDPLLGEHVDGHQLLFARRLGIAGLVNVSLDQEGFRRKVRQALDRERRPSAGRGNAPALLVSRFGELVQSAVDDRRREGTQEWLRSKK